LYFIINTQYFVWAAESESLLDNFFTDLETYSAAFEQQLVDESDVEIEKFIGMFYMRRPGMFRWVYCEPYLQMIISDGNTLWIYDEDLEQTIIRNIGDATEDSPAAILGGEVRINNHYLMIELEASDGISWMELTPRDAGSQYDSIRLGFIDNQLTKLILFDSLGQKNSITFIDTIRNKTLAIELFGFTPPEGIDIIDNR